MFIPNASGCKTRCENRFEGEKVLLRKFASSIRDFSCGLWYRKSLFLEMVQEEEEVCGGSLNIQGALHCRESRKL